MGGRDNIIKIFQTHSHSHSVLMRAVTDTSVGSVNGLLAKGLLVLPGLHI